MSEPIKILKNILDLDMIFSFEVEPKNPNDYIVNFKVKQLSQRRKVLIPYIVRKDGSVFNIKNFSLKLDISLMDIHGVSMPVLCDNLYLSKIPGPKS